MPTSVTITITRTFGPQVETTIPIGGSVASVLPTAADPVEFELPGNEAVMRKEGERLIIEPKQKKPDLFAWLATLEPLEEDFPDVDEGLLPLKDVDL